MIERSYPVLRIDDYEEAKIFYVDFLGFEIEFEWRHVENFPVYMGLLLGDLGLHLTEHRGDLDGLSHLVFGRQVRDPVLETRRREVLGTPGSAPDRDNRARLHGPIHNYESPLGRQKHRHRRRRRLPFGGPAKAGPAARSGEGLRFSRARSEMVVCPADRAGDASCPAIPLIGAGTRYLPVPTRVPGRLARNRSNRRADHRHRN